MAANVKKMLYLEERQAGILKRLALEERASETEVMRRALEAYAQTRLEDPLLELIGSLSGGPKTGARDHDRYVLPKKRGA